MHKITLTLLLLISPFFLHAQFDASEKIKKKIIQDRYLEFLDGKGYPAEVDSDGDIKFRYNDKPYYITISMKDERFFRLARLGNLKLDTEEKRRKLYKISHDLTSELKVSKVYWVNSTLWASTELIVGEKEDYEAIFDRALRLTASAYNKFLTAWREGN